MQLNPVLASIKRTESYATVRYVAYAEYVYKNKKNRCTECSVPRPPMRILNIYLLSAESYMQ